jgi:hypothetical protein
MNDRKVLVKEDRLLLKQKIEREKKKRILTPELLSLIAKSQGVKRTIIK